MDVSLIGSFNQQKGLEDTWSNIWSRDEMETTSESIEVHDAKATSHWGLMAATECCKSNSKVLHDDQKNCTM